MWYDILVLDFIHGWQPVNIKTTTTTSDNTGNLAMCVYAYTNHDIHLRQGKDTENGKMSVILLEKLKCKNYNKVGHRDYYFIVLNKTDSTDVIINSVKGLAHLTPNINNLPFQIHWGRNRKYRHVPIRESIRQFVACLKKPQPCWKELFMAKVRSLE
jgi:hypothetical protein